MDTESAFIHELDFATRLLSSQRLLAGPGGVQYVASNTRCHLE
jgi:hypothetical protein